MRRSVGNASPKKKQWKITRDSILFVAGLLGIAYETVVVNVDRPSLLVLFAGMVGLPAFFFADERKRNSPPPPDPPSTKGRGPDA